MRSTTCAQATQAIPTSCNATPTGCAARTCPFACTWKLLYYAPNTFQLWRRKAGRRRGEPGSERVDDIQYTSVFNPFTEEGRAFLRSSVLPYGAVKFVALPALFAPLGPWAVWSVLANTLMAEVLANVQSFFLIVPNHAAADLPCFEGPPRGRADFAHRQIAGTANYRTGGALRDFAHAWMSYHIEHHLFPDLPLLKYEQFQERIRETCEAHGLPYRQESLLRRAWRSIQIMVGAESMSPAREEASSCPA
jgi:fatty acid desaturase